MHPLMLLAAALADARPVTPDYDGNCQSPVWSPDGSQLAYEVNYHDRKSIELYIYTPGAGAPKPVRPRSRGTTGLTAGFATDSAEQVSHELSWAPAAIGSFVFSASGSERDYDLYLAQGAAIGSAPGADGGPSWSPDGRYIAFTSARTGQGDLYLLDINDLSRPPRQLTSDPDAAELYATWSADGHSLAYVGHSESGDRIVMIDIDGASPPQTIALGRTQTRPSWSPDGRAVAFYSNHEDPERFDLWVLPLGGQPTLIDQDVVMSHRGPSWTPDSSRLVYVRNDDDRFDPVWVAPVDGGRARRVQTGTVGNSDIAVTRGTDGQTWLAISAQGLTTDTVRDFKRIYVMALPER